MTPLNLSHGYMLTYVVAVQLMDGCLIFSSMSDISKGKIKNELRSSHRGAVVNESD